MKKTLSIHALLCFITASAFAADDRYPPQGTQEWRELFAVDPSETPLAFAAMPAPKDPLTFNSTFKGEIAGFDVGRIYLDVAASEERYAVNYKMEQRGIARWFGDAIASSRARGGFGEDGIDQHYYFNHDYEAEDDQQFVEIFRDKGEPRMHLWTKPTYSFHQPVGEELAMGSVDPMGALVALGFMDNNNGDNPCDRTIDVFDGRRLFNLRFSDQGTEKLRRRGNNIYRGTAYKCKLHQTKIAGYRESKRGDVEGNVWVYLVEVPEPFRTEKFAYVPVMIKVRAGIFNAWLEGQNPTITAPDGTSVNLGKM